MISHNLFKNLFPHRLSLSRILIYKITNHLIFLLFLSLRHSLIYQKDVSLPTLNRERSTLVVGNYGVVFAGKCQKPR